MALLMICVRMKLDAPPREPEMIRTLLPSRNPMAAVARPDHEFSSAMVTGVSAPPAATVSRIPYTISPSPGNSPCWNASQFRDTVSRRDKVAPRCSDALVCNPHHPTESEIVSALQRFNAPNPLPREFCDSLFREMHS